MKDTFHNKATGAQDRRYQIQWWAVSLVDVQPFQGKKKAADKGIAGVMYFHDIIDLHGGAVALTARETGGTRATVVFKT